MKPRFRARSPRVLLKEPFKPVLDHSHSQPLPVVLNTEKRRDKRRDFEMQQSLREEQTAYERTQVSNLVICCTVNIVCSAITDDNFIVSVPT